MATHTIGSEIVVGVDDSPAAEGALRWAAAEAALRGDRLVILHAVVPTVSPWPAVPIPVGLLGWQLDTAHQILHDAEQTAKNASNGSVSVSTELTVAAPAPALVERSKSARMVVVGSRGQRALARVVLGSVSTSLVHQAHSSVAVIHDHSPVPDPDGAVVLGYDGSPPSETAAAIALEEASLRGAQLIVLHAWWPVELYEYTCFDWDGMEPSVDRELSERIDRWRRVYPDVEISKVVVRDDAARRLVEQSRAAQLVVVGSHGHGAVSRALLGSVSTAVVQAAMTPVLVVRPQ